VGCLFVYFTIVHVGIDSTHGAMQNHRQIFMILTPAAYPCGRYPNPCEECFMSKSPDSFAPAMQNFVQAGQALAQNFLEFLNTQKAAPAPGMRASSTPKAPDPEQLASLQKSYMEQQLQLWNSMLTRGKDEPVASVVAPEPGDRRFSSAQFAFHSRIGRGVAR
jgi:hypothetical protein